MKKLVEVTQCVATLALCVLVAWAASLLITIANAMKTTQDLQMMQLNLQLGSVKPCSKETEERIISERRQR